MDPNDVAGTIWVAKQGIKYVIPASLVIFSLFSLLTFLIYTLRTMALVPMFSGVTTAYLQVITILSPPSVILSHYIFRIGLT